MRNFDRQALATNRQKYSAANTLFNQGLVLGLYLPSEKGIVTKILRAFLEDAGENTLTPSFKGTIWNTPVTSGDISDIYDTSSRECTAKHTEKLVLKNSEWYYLNAEEFLDSNGYVQNAVTYCFELLNWYRYGVDFDNYKFANDKNYRGDFDNNTYYGEESHITRDYAAKYFEELGKPIPSDTSSKTPTVSIKDKTPNSPVITLDINGIEVTTAKELAACKLADLKRAFELEHGIATSEKKPALVNYWLKKLLGETS